MPRLHSLSWPADDGFGNRVRSRGSFPNGPFGSFALFDLECHSQVKHQLNLEETLFLSSSKRVCFSFPNSGILKKPKMQKKNAFFKSQQLFSGGLRDFDQLRDQD